MTYEIRENESECNETKPGRIVPRIEFNPTGEGDINDVLIKTLAEAHANTNLKLEIVHEMLRKNQVRIRWVGGNLGGQIRFNSMAKCAIQDPGRVQFYKSMGQEDLWLDCAEKLTAMIQNIIEFAKLIPGFMRLSQDDQVRDAVLKNAFRCSWFSFVSHCRFCC